MATGRRRAQMRQSRPRHRGLHAVSHDAFPALSSQQRSLTRFLIEEQRAVHVNPELRLLIEVVARACKRIPVAVGKGALGGVLGDAEGGDRSAEHTSELQSLKSIPYPVL